jgi:23S rRNA pseudouridine2605 synthase
LELQRQDKGKSLVKSMGRTIQLEAPKVKLTKYLSGASVMSTRAAKKLVKAGHILVNKKRVYENVKVSDYDKVEIWSKDGTKYVGKEDARLWIFYKPRGLVCTDFDPERRLTVMDYLRESGQILGTPKQLKSLNPKLKKNNKFDYEEIKREDAGEHRNIDVIEHVISVGRLDFNSEGLLLLTNDGDLARALELPSNKVERVSLI